MFAGKISWKLGIERGFFRFNLVHVRADCQSEIRVLENIRKRRLIEVWLEMLWLRSLSKILLMCTFIVHSLSDRCNLRMWSLNSIFEWRSTKGYLRKAISGSNRTVLGSIDKKFVRRIFLFVRTRIWFSDALLKNKNPRWKGRLLCTRCAL